MLLEPVRVPTQVHGPALVHLGAAELERRPGEEDERAEEQRHEQQVVAADVDGVVDEGRLGEREAPDRVPGWSARPETPPKTFREKPNARCGVPSVGTKLTS